MRPLLDDVLAADWSPDGRELAVVRSVGGEWQLEYPIGRVLWRPAPILADWVRVSPDGERVAMVDVTGVTLIDRDGRQTRLTAPFAQYSAWSPGSEALLVASGETLQYRRLRRLGLDGSLREIYPVPGSIGVHDVSRSGLVLIHHGFDRVGTRARAPGEEEEHEVGAYAYSRPVALSADGSQLLLVDSAESGGVSLLRPTRGGPVVRLGQGYARGLSDDGQWVLMEDSGDGAFGLSLTPTGAGALIPLLLGGLTESPTFPGRANPARSRPPAFHVDGRRVGFSAAEPGRPMRSFWVEPPDGAPRPVTPEGVIAVPGLLKGERLLGLAADGSVAIYPVRGGPPQPLPWRLPSNRWGIDPFRVSADGRFLHVRQGMVPARIDRIEILTGRRTVWKTLGTESRGGVGHIFNTRMTPDGEGYAYGYGEWLQDLYLVEGLRF